MNLTRRAALKSLVATAAVAAAPAALVSIVGDKAMLAHPRSRYTALLVDKTLQLIDCIETFRGREFDPSKDWLSISLPDDADDAEFREFFLAGFPEARKCNVVPGIYRCWHHGMWRNKLRVGLWGGCTTYASADVNNANKA